MALVQVGHHPAQDVGRALPAAGGILRAATPVLTPDRFGLRMREYDTQTSHEVGR